VLQAGKADSAAQFPTREEMVDHRQPNIDTHYTTFTITGI